MNKGHKKPGALPRLMGLIVIAALLSSGGCSQLGRRLSGAPPLQIDFSLIRPEDFPAKIRQLEDMSQNDKNLSVRTRALFYVALAHMHYKNPSPDYAKAVDYLDKYMALESARKDIDEMVAWKSVVATLDTSLREHEKLVKDYAQLKQQYDRANKKGDSLAKVNEDQKREIAALKQMIKELDAVQQEIEKKRKGIKK